MGLTDRGRASAAAGVTLTLAGMTLGFEEVTRLGLFAVGLVLLAALYARATPPRVEVETGMPTSPLHVGQTATVRLHVRPRGRRSPTLRLEQHLPSPPGGSARRLIPPLAAPETLDVDLTVRFDRRGRHEVPPCVLIREDPFGLTRLDHTAGAGHTVTVLPRVHPLGTAPHVGAGARSEGAALQVSPLAGEEYGSIRVYAPGDDLRRIHWPVTAHRGELMTRHDERPSTRHALLVLDPALADPAAPAVLEWGIELLASAVHAVEREGMTVDLVTAGATVTSRTVHDSGTEALQVLALVPTASRSSLPSAGTSAYIEQVRDQASHAGVVVLVASGSRVEATRGLVLALPPGVRGLLFFVTAGPNSVAPELLETASRIGWSVQACSPATSHADAWHDAIEAAAP